MKTIKDFICKVFFILIGYAITALEAYGLCSWVWFTDGMDNIPSVYAQLYLTIAILVGLYNINMRIIWKAVKHFND